MAFLLVYANYDLPHDCDPHPLILDELEQLGYRDPWTKATTVHVTLTSSELAGDNNWGSSDGSR